MTHFLQGISSHFWWKIFSGDLSSTKMNDLHKLQFPESSHRKSNLIVSIWHLKACQAMLAVKSWNKIWILAFYCNAILKQKLHFVIFMEKSLTADSLSYFFIEEFSLHCLALIIFSLTVSEVGKIKREHAHRSYVITWTKILREFILCWGSCKLLINLVILSFSSVLCTRMSNK